MSRKLTVSIAWGVAVLIFGDFCATMAGSKPSYLLIIPAIIVAVFGYCSPLEGFETKRED